MDNIDRKQFLDLKEALNSIEYKGFRLGNFDNKYIMTLLGSTSVSPLKIVKNLFFYNSLQLPEKPENLVYLPPRRFYRKRLKRYLKNFPSVEFSFIDNSAYSQRLSFDFFALIKSFRVLRKVKLSIGFYNWLYLYSFTVLFTRMVDEVLGNKKLYKVKSFFSFLPFHYRVSLLNDFFQLQKIGTYSFQIANSYNPPFFKPYEVEWLGLNIKNIYTYGKFYTTFFRKLYPGANVTTLSETYNPDVNEEKEANTDNIVIWGNQPSLKQYNLEMIDLVLCSPLLKQKNIYFIPHPVDKANYYRKMYKERLKIPEKLIEELRQSIHIANDSSVIFDLRKAGKVVFNLNLSESGITFLTDQLAFSNAEELYKLIDSFKFSKYTEIINNDLCSIF